MISRNQRSIIVSFFLFIFAVVFGIFFFKPLMINFKTVFQTVKKVNSKRDSIAVNVNTIPRMLKEKKELEVKLREYEKRLPSEDKIPLIVSQIAQKTKGLDVEIISISSGDEKELEGRPVFSKPIIIHMLANFKTIAQYLNLIETIETALSIKNVVIQKKSNLNSPKLSVSIVLETYIAKGT